MSAIDARGHGAAHAQAARRFNRGEFLGAARVWGEIWHALGADEGPGGPDDPRPPPPEARLYRGLIRLAAGFARWREGRLAPARRLLGMGLSDLEAVGPVRCELDVSCLRVQARSFLEALESGRGTPVVPVVEVEEGGAP